jgi:succinate dehydrogenase hydrophobic anchor subunit
MNFTQVANSQIVLGTLALLDLAYFTNLCRFDKPVWTFANTQLFTIITGYIGYVYASAVVYYGLSQVPIEDAGVLIQTAYTVSFFFVSLAECAYLEHAWSSVKVVFRNSDDPKCILFQKVLKVLLILFFLPCISLAISFLLDNRFFYLFAILAIESLSGLVFIFDSFVAYNFFTFLVSDTPKTTNQVLVARHGLLASTGVLLTIVNNFVSLVFVIGNNIPASNIFTVLAMIFLQVPILALVRFKMIESRHTLDEGLVGGLMV